MSEEHEIFYHEQKKKMSFRIPPRKWTRLMGKIGRIYEYSMASCIEIL
jgi:hypothetical protein